MPAAQVEDTQEVIVPKAKPAPVDGQPITYQKFITLSLSAVGVGVVIVGSILGAYGVSYQTKHEALAADVSEIKSDVKAIEKSLVEIRILVARGNGGDRKD